MDQDNASEQLPLNLDETAEEAPKPKRRRRKKTDAAEAVAASADVPSVDAQAADAQAAAAQTADPAAQPGADTEQKAEVKTRRRAVRPRSGAAKPAPQAAEDADAPADAGGSAADADAPAKPAPKRRGRKPKAAAQPAAEKAVEAAEKTPAAVKRTEPATMEADAAAAPSDGADTVSAQAAEGEGSSSAKTEEHGDSAAAAIDAGPRVRRRHRRLNRDQPAGGDQAQQGQGSQQGAAQQGQQGQGATQQHQQDQGTAPSNQQAQQQNNRRRGRHNKNAQQTPTEPTLTREELEGMKVADLRAKAAELDIDATGKRKGELVEEIYTAAAAAEGFRAVAGVIQIQPEGYAFLRTGNFGPGDNDAFVHQQLIRQYGLRPGDYVKGSTGPGRANNKFPPLQHVESVNGRKPEEVKHRPRFRDLTPVYPNERLRMEAGKDTITGRAIDLVAPIGKGQRGLIVSPPKAGKTTVLKKICQSIAANNPEVHLFCLLVDERPEEVTDMERSIRGTVVASTFDMPASNHTAVSEMVIEHAKRLVELGEDVVVVLDSITRLARAYNLAQPASGRVLSGGVDSAALYPPKKFLGAARNIENGGSLTILASALVDTGSKMDEVIYEEFKGTGNMELKLDRDLADRRIFPAIDPVASGTRNEDLLIDPQIQPFVWGIRRILANMNNTERAATALVKGLKATNTNEEFLIRSAKKAAQSEYVA